MNYCFKHAACGMQQNAQSKMDKAQGTKHNAQRATPVAFFNLTASRSDLSALKITAFASLLMHKAQSTRIRAL